MPWTPEELEKLRVLSRGTGSSAEIAQILGKTRNMVIGKLRRMGLSLPGAVGPKGVYRINPLRPPRKRPERPSVVQAPPQRPSLKTPPAATPVRLHGDCQWIYGDPKSPGWSKCNHATYKNSSYCEEHYHKVYVPVPHQRRLR